MYRLRRTTLAPPFEAVLGVIDSIVRLCLGRDREMDLGLELL